MTFLDCICVGIFACVVFDITQQVVKRLTGLPPSNWAIVGRWFWGVVTDGKIIAKDLPSKDPKPHELRVGWIIHYLVAIGYAVFFSLLVLADILDVSVRHGLIFGMVSVIVPWFFFMPALGNGLLARRTPNPLLACGLAFMMHSIFGIAVGVGFVILT